MQTPTVGRIVHYQHPGSADGKYAPVVSPAIVQAVNEDGSLRLWVFGPWGLHIAERCRQSTSFPPDPSSWFWPPRAEIRDQARPEPL